MFKSGLSFQRLNCDFEESKLGNNRDASLICNSTAVLKIIGDIARKYEKLYANKGFVYWYAIEGLPEYCVEEARCCLDGVYNEYQTIHSNKDIS